MTDLHDVDWSRLPPPVDDGAADHLVGTDLPSVSLQSTTGEPVDLSQLAGIAVIYAYPMTGTPGRALPDGWDVLPGARGCTPQACAFRDHASELGALGVRHLFGVSTQSVSDQTEAAERLHLPFALLSDQQLELAEAMRLPTMTVEGCVLLRRLTLIVQERCVVAAFYPVFPPDEAPNQVLAWLADRNERTEPTEEHC